MNPPTKLTTHYFTFGQTHVHSVNGKTFDKDCVVKVTADSPRDIMFITFGRKWSMEYDSIEQVGIEFYPRGVIEL